MGGGNYAYYTEHSDNIVKMYLYSRLSLRADIIFAKQKAIKTTLQESFYISIN